MEKVKKDWEKLDIAIKKDKISQQIAEVFWADTEVAAKLAQLPTQSLISLLLDVYETRSINTNAHDIIGQYEWSRFPKASKSNIKGVHNIENIILNGIYDRDFIRLSPVFPFWLAHFLSNVSQKRALTTTRGYDITSDGSMGLALEAAILRKKEKTKETIKLATFLTCLRTQSFYGANDFHNKPKAHFQVMANCYAWRSMPWYGFEKEHTYDMLDKYLYILQHLKNEWHIKFESIEITISDLNILPYLFKAKESLSTLDEWAEQAHLFRKYQLEYRTKHGFLNEPQLDTYFWLENKLKWRNITVLSQILNDNDIDFNVEYLWKIGIHLQQLEEKYKDIGLNISYDLWRTWWVGHYKWLAFSWFLQNESWGKCDVFDGGIVDWPEKLLSDKKEKMLVWGMWTDLLANKYNV